MARTPTLPAQLPAYVRTRYRMATVETEHFAGEVAPSVGNHPRITAIMTSVRELAVLTADEIHGSEESELDSLDAEVLDFIEDRVIALATRLAAQRMGVAS